MLFIIVNGGRLLFFFCRNASKVERHGRPGRIPSSRTAPAPASREQYGYGTIYNITTRKENFIRNARWGGEKPTGKIELARCKRGEKISRSDSFFLLSVSVCLPVAVVGRSAREISLFPDEISVVRAIIRGDFATIIGKTVRRTTESGTNESGVGSGWASGGDR